MNPRTLSACLATLAVWQKPRDYGYLGWSGIRRAGAAQAIDERVAIVCTSQPLASARPVRRDYACTRKFHTRKQTK